MNNTQKNTSPNNRPFSATESTLVSAMSGEDLHKLEESMKRKELPDFDPLARGFEFMAPGKMMVKPVLCFAAFVAFFIFLSLLSLVLGDWVPWTVSYNPRGIAMAVIAIPFILAVVVRTGVFHHFWLVLEPGQFRLRLRILIHQRDAIIRFADMESIECGRRRGVGGIVVHAKTGESISLIRLPMETKPLDQYVAVIARLVAEAAGVPLVEMGDVTREGTEEKRKGGFENFAEVETLPVPAGFTFIQGERAEDIPRGKNGRHVPPYSGTALFGIERRAFELVPFLFILAMVSVAGYYVYTWRDEYPGLLDVDAWGLDTLFSLVKLLGVPYLGYLFLRSVKFILLGRVRLVFFAESLAIFRLGGRKANLWAMVDRSTVRCIKASPPVLGRMNLDVEENGRTIRVPLAMSRDCADWLGKYLAAWSGKPFV